MAGTIYLLSFRHRIGQEVQFVFSSWIKILIFLQRDNLMRLRECGWFEFDVIPSSESTHSGGNVENVEILFQASPSKGIDPSILGDIKYRDFRQVQSDWIEGEVIGLREIPD
jgi:hypothetical protein